MFQELKKRLSLNLKTLSLFKAFLAILTLLAFPSLRLLLLWGLYFFILDRYAFYIFIPLALITLLRLNLNPYFLNVGIVSVIEEDYYIVRKPFYKVILHSDENLNYGDLLYFEGAGSDLKKAKSYSDLRKGIYWEIEADSVEVLKTNNSLRKMVYERLDNLNNERLKAYLKKAFYYENDYDNLSSFFINCGFAYYYFLRYIQNRWRKKKIIIPLIIAHSLLFGIQNHIILFTLSALAKYLTQDKLSRITLLMGLIIILNPFWLYSYTFSLPLLFRLFAVFFTPLRFRTFLLIVQSLLFGQISLFRTLFYRFYIGLLAFIYLASWLVLIVPSWGLYYLKIMDFITYLADYDWVLKGKISLLMVLMIILFIYGFLKIGRYIQSLLIIFTLYFHLSSPYISVSFIDVGQGDAILIHDAFLQNTILIDTGSPYQYYKLENYLNDLGVRKIDYLIITHNDDDHSGNIASLINDYIVQEVVTSARDIEVGPFYFNSLNNPIYDNANDNSLVYYLKIDQLAFLFTGDIGKETEADIWRKSGPFAVDILKLAHHGSITSSSLAFLNNINPQIAIASTSGMYNHPSSEVVENLKSLDIKLLTTKDSGSIRFYLPSYIQFYTTAKGEFGIIFKE